LEEVFEIADRITVIRDGKKIQTAEVKEVTPDDVVFMMVGHKVEVQAHSDEYAIQPDPILTVEQVSYKPFLEDISFVLNRGEILGITGPAGSGKTAIARLLFGVDHPDKGSISVRSVSSSFKQPSFAIRSGIGYVPQNRHGEGVLLGDPILKNVSLPSMNKLSRFGFINKSKEKSLSLEYIRKLAIKASSYNMQVQNLSGGNQQKVSIAKWLALHPEVLILDEPTQGIDVNTKQEIYQLVKELARTGVSIVLISSEPAELVQLSDRVAIIRRGKIVNYLNGASITRENIIKEVTGAKETSNNHEHRSES
jgi:ABC-type sugar transport system ATPase subunit